MASIETYPHQFTALIHNIYYALIRYIVAAIKPEMYNIICFKHQEIPSTYSPSIPVPHLHLHYGSVDPSF
jgi:hypothetical protein